MDNIQGLYYAFGQLAYAVAASDGSIDAIEKRTLHDQLKKTANDHNPDINYSEIIFQVFAKEHTDVKTAYDWAMKEMRLNEYYLSETLKKDFINILEKLAEAKPPVTPEKKAIIARFKKDIELLKADSVFTK